MMIGKLITGTIKLQTITPISLLYGTMNIWLSVVLFSAIRSNTITAIILDYQVANKSEITSPRICQFHIAGLCCLPRKLSVPLQQMRERQESKNPINIYWTICFVRYHSSRINCRWDEFLSKMTIFEGKVIRWVLYAVVAASLILYANHFSTYILKRLFWSCKEACIVDLLFFERQGENENEIYQSYEGWIQTKRSRTVKNNKLIEAKKYFAFFLPKLIKLVSDKKWFMLLDAQNWRKYFCATL